MCTKIINSIDLTVANVFSSVCFKHYGVMLTILSHHAPACVAFENANKNNKQKQHVEHTAPHELFLDPRVALDVPHLARSRPQLTLATTQNHKTKKKRKNKEKKKKQKEIYVYIYIYLLVGGVKGGLEDGVGSRNHPIPAGSAQMSPPVQECCFSLVL